tara:strand:- start:1092 stop:1559 length:468 start_codon:yes stop_codon:yes gene_type:complete
LQDLKTILDKEGQKGVPLYRESLVENDRVATGKTRDSIGYRVTTNELIFFGREDITWLEDGASAQDIQSKGNFFEQLNEWVQARGLGDSAVTGLIMGSLQANGWNTDLPNRTNPNGGTKGILTNPSKIIIEDTKKALLDSSLSLVRASFNTFKDK